MSEYRILAIDIDGTLVNSRDELTQPTVSALRRAADAGIHLVLATGRRYSRSLHLVEPLGIEVPLITSSGALIKDARDHQTLYVAEFPRDVLCDALTIIDRLGYDPVICADTYSQGFDYYHARAEVDGAELGEYLRMNEGSGRVLPNMVKAPPLGIFTGFAMGTKQQMLRLDEALHRELPGQLDTHVLRSPRYTGFMCEIAPAGATKWSAIARLASEWRIEASAICAVGDDVNDIPMIRQAGLGIAMGNALPEVKQVADRVAPTHDENGLVTVVEWLLY